MCTLLYKKYVFLHLAVVLGDLLLWAVWIYIGNIIVLIRRLSICKELYTLYKKFIILTLLWWPSLDDDDNKI